MFIGHLRLLGTALAIRPQFFHGFFLMILCTTLEGSREEPRPATKAHRKWTSILFARGKFCHDTYTGLEMWLSS